MPAELHGRNARAHLSFQHWKHFPFGFVEIQLYSQMEESVILDVRRALYEAILRRLQ